MGNWFSSAPPLPKARYEVVLPSGCRAWEQLYCGGADNWDAGAARYGMDKFAYNCGVYNCDREAVCLRYFKATLQSDKQAISIERFLDMCLQNVVNRPVYAQTKLETKPKYKHGNHKIPVSSSVGLRALLSEGFQLNEVVAAERGQMVLLVVRKSIDYMSQVAFPLIHLGNGSQTKDKKKDTDKPWLPWRHSIRRDHGESKAENKKRASSSGMDERGAPQDRQGNQSETERTAGGDRVRARCIGVLHAPHKDMTIISCHLSPDLSQTAVMFYSLSKASGTFCYTLHCYSNDSLREESSRDAQARALSSAAALENKAASVLPEPPTPHLLQTVKLSREVQPYFVYDPRYRASRIAVANYECRDMGIAHELVVLSLDGAGDADRDAQVVERGKLSLPSLFGNSRFNLLYSKDGQLIILQKLTDDRFGVTSFCDIYIFNSDTLTLIKYMTSSLPGLFHICKVSYEPVFSRCGSFMRILDHRCVSYVRAGEDRAPFRGNDLGDDEHTVVQIYQLPRILNLMSQCRRVILQQVSTCHSIELLPLPHKLHDYLRFGPIY